MAVSLLVPVGATPGILHCLSGKGFVLTLVVVVTAMLPVNHRCGLETDVDMLYFCVSCLE
jgi:hypothetical protein